MEREAVVKGRPPLARWPACALLLAPVFSLSRPRLKRGRGRSDLIFTLYSTSELKRAHECTGRASARNVQLFLMIGNPSEDFLEENQVRMKEVVSKCLVCERFGVSLRRLRIAAAHEYIFNCVFGFDVLHLVGREPKLDMICCGTRMVVTCELPNNTSAEIWKNFS